MDRLGLTAEVDGIIYWADLGTCKPVPSLFETAAERVGGTPDDLHLVEDTKRTANAATATGWGARHWQTGTRLFEELRRQS